MRELPRCLTDLLLGVPAEEDTDLGEWIEPKPGDLSLEPLQARHLGLDDMANHYLPVYFDTCPDFEYVRRENGTRGEILNSSKLPLWSGQGEPPAIGAEVAIKINRLGRCVVVSYFVQDRWLGLLVRLLDPPEWFVKQNPITPDRAYVFGAEIDYRQAA